MMEAMAKTLLYSRQLVFRNTNCCLKTYPISDEAVISFDNFVVVVFF